MTINEFYLSAVSPMFLNGADKEKPELRAASVRGQLRYWLRAYLGAQYSNLQQIWDAESAVFGSTGHGSVVSVRVYGNPDTNKKYPLLPHREDTGNVSEVKAIRPNPDKPDNPFTLQLVTRPGVRLPEHALTALKLWSLLGGMGKRSRRMMGAVRIVAKGSAKEIWYTYPSTPKELMDTIQAALVGCHDLSASVPNFPTLQPRHSWIVVGTESFGGANKANQDFFRKLLRANPHRDDKAYGFAGGGGRRASPIHAQVRKIGDEYYPVFTAFRSAPEPPNSAGKISALMKAIVTEYNGITAWGGW